jgi:gliding motility-associated-like protein
MNDSPRYIRMLRKIALLIMIMVGMQLHAQYDCTIYPGDTTVCYGTTVTFVTTLDTNLTYFWEPNGETLPFIKVEAEDTSSYVLHTYNQDSSFYCTDTVTLSIFPRVIIEYEQVVFGCPPADSNQVDTICKAQVKASATGGYPPYHYDWGDSTMVNYGDSSWALNLCVNRIYILKVSDTICNYTANIDVEPFDMPEIEVTVQPDSLFDTNPQAILSFENKSADSIPITAWTWIFPDGTSTNQMTPSYVFTVNDSLVKFTYTTIDNCNDTIYIPVNVQEFKLTVPNVFTPNGDGVNDKYEIPNLDRYISNELYVFDRWGTLVFKENNYNNGWDGGRLPDGVYFYILKCQGYWKEDVFRGSVSIYGSRY